MPNPSWDDIDDSWEEPGQATARRRTRARGKQKRRSNRATRQPPQRRPRQRASVQGPPAPDRGRTKGPSRPWLLPVAVLLAAITVFVLALVASAK